MKCLVEPNSEAAAAGHPADQTQLDSARPLPPRGAACKATGPRSGLCPLPRSALGRRRALHLQRVVHARPHQRLQQGGLQEGAISSPSLGRLHRRTFQRCAVRISSDLSQVCFILWKPVCSERQRGHLIHARQLLKSLQIPQQSGFHNLQASLQALGYHLGSSEQALMRIIFHSLPIARLFRLVAAN